MHENNRIEVTQTPWQNCIAVCSKCSRKLNAMDKDKTCLRAGLKALIKERGLKNKVRAVDSSCFDICPEGRIVVVHFTENGITPITVTTDTAPTEVLSQFGY
ncbi:MAG TPA: hypothetical protein PLY93_02490 [Turneriella sp.]|nr:hypothetical protein [Turneriella sp.]